MRRAKRPWHDPICEVWQGEECDCGLAHLTGPAPPGSVLGFLLDNDLEYVVLVKREEPAWQRGLYNAPGGALEPAEEPMHGVERQFHRRTGLILNTWRPFARLRKAGEQVVDLFTTTMAAGRIEGSLREVQAVLWVIDEEETVQGAKLPAAGLVPDLIWLVRLARAFHQGDGRFHEVAVRGYTTE
jgi:8-oxo-dGTP diphosphatase